MSDRFVTFISRPEIWFGLTAVAAFLSLYWFLRGAPPGQAAPKEPEGEGVPNARARDRIAALAVLGLIVVAAGGVVAIEVGVPWSIPLFALGFVGEIALVRANRRYQHASPMLRRVVRFADAGVTASLLAGILIVGNVLAFKYGDRPFDFTRERVFSLESLTVNQLRSLDKPVHFTAFYGDDPLVRRQLDRIIQLLELYKAENPRRISFELVHPYSNPAESEKLRARAPGVAVTPGGGVLIEYGDGDATERVVVSYRELFTAGPATGEGPPETVFRGEDALTSALVQLREARKPKIAFITGHGEPSIHDMDPSKPGLGLLRARLEAIGAEAVVSNLVAGPLAPDLTLAVIAAPQSPFEPGELDRLNEFLARGGRLVVMLNGRAPAGLDVLLAAHRLSLGSNPIVDPTYCFRGRPSLPTAPIVGDPLHPVVAPLRNQAPIVPDATALTIEQDPSKSPPSPRREVATPILRTSPSSWAESDPQRRELSRDPDRDPPGPFTVGVAVTSATITPPGPEEPMMVVFSSPMLGDNRLIAYRPANLDLIANAVSWLRGRPDLQGLAPRTHTALAFSADPGLRTRLVLLPTVLAFALIIGLGVAIYLARRA